MYFPDADREQLINSANANPLPSYPAPGLEESLARSATDILEGQSSIRNSMAVTGIWQDELARFKSQTGAFVPFSNGPWPSDPKYQRPFGEARYHIDQWNQQHPDAPFVLPEDDQIQKQADARVRGAQSDEAALSAGPRSFGTSVGSLAGGLVGTAADPANLAAMGAMGLLGAPGAAARLMGGGLLGEIGGGATADAAGFGLGQGITEASNFSQNRRFDPEFGAGDVAKSVAGAAVSGAVMGAGGRTLGAVTGYSFKQAAKAWKSYKADAGIGAGADATVIHPTQPETVPTFEEWRQGVDPNEPVAKSQADYDAYLKTLAPAEPPPAATIDRDTMDDGNVTERTGNVIASTPEGADPVEHAAKLDAAMDAVNRGEVPAIPESAPEQAPAPPAQAEAPVTGYTTAKGSTYIVHEDGTTTRNKAARPDAGHEGDSGVKPRTEKTVYVNGDASALSVAGMTISGSKGARVIIKDGKATLLTWNDQAGRWGVMPGSRDIAISDKPGIGLEPLELWKKTDDIPGYEAYRGMHAGNKITEVKTADPGIAKAQATAAQIIEDARQERIPVAQKLAGMDYVDDVDPRVRALIGLEHTGPDMETRVDTIERQIRQAGLNEPDGRLSFPDWESARAAPVKPDVPEPRTLTQFVAGIGGIRDVKDELKGMGLTMRLSRKAGMEIDRVREAATEAGYLGGDTSATTPRELLDALADETKGTKHYSTQDEQAAAQWRSYQDAKSARPLDDHFDLAQARKDIRRELGEYAPDEKTPYGQRVAYLVATGMEPDAALERAAIEMEDAGAHIATVKARDNIPGFDHGNEAQRAGAPESSRGLPPSSGDGTLASGEAQPPRSSEAPGQPGEAGRSPNLADRAALDAALTPEAIAKVANDPVTKNAVVQDAIRLMDRNGGDLKVPVQIGTDVNGEAIHEMRSLASVFDELDKEGAVADEMKACASGMRTGEPT